MVDSNSNNIYNSYITKAITYTRSNSKDPDEKAITDYVTNFFATNVNESFIESIIKKLLQKPIKKQEVQGLQAFALVCVRVNLTLLHIWNENCLKKIRMLIVKKCKIYHKRRHKIFQYKIYIRFLYVKTLNKYSVLWLQFSIHYQGNVVATDLCLFDRSKTQERLAFRTGLFAVIIIMI